MLCEGLQWPDAIFGAGSNPWSRDMKRLAVAAVAGLAATLTLVPVTTMPAERKDIHAEVIEWVFAPCMDVAAAIGVDGLDEESIDLGIGRRHVAMLMLAERDSAIRELTDKMKPNATWEERSAAYPALLRLCLAQFSKQ